MKIVRNKTENYSVASVKWAKHSELHRIQGETLEQLGYQHTFLNFNEPIPDQTQVIFIQGPYGPLYPLIHQLEQYPPDQKPVLVYWFQQSLNMFQTEWMRRYFGIWFSELHRNDVNDGWQGRVHNKVFPHFLHTKGSRFGFLGDIIWLNKRGLLDVLALSSSVYSEYLGGFGIDSLVVPRGYHPSYGEVTNERERDIGVVWMGKVRTSLRKRKIYWLQEQLAKRGIEMLIFDGEQNDFIFKEKRQEILNRTWFVLNVFFSGPTDELSIRFYVAAANGAVILTEPGENKYPFIDGVHYLESPVAEMPDVIASHLKEKDKLIKISRNMQTLMKSRLTLHQSIETIMKQVERYLQERGRYRPESKR
jgi:hypothetical protein